MIKPLIFIAVIIWCIAFMVTRKSKVPDGQSSNEPLTSNEKFITWVICVFNPIWGGAIMYYGWKKKLQEKAKQANKISIIAFLITLAGFILLNVLSKGQ